MPAMFATSGDPIDYLSSPRLIQGRTEGKARRKLYKGMEMKDKIRRWHLVEVDGEPRHPQWDVNELSKAENRDKVIRSRERAIGKIERPQIAREQRITRERVQAAQEQATEAGTSPASIILDI